eukprot:400015_1
MKSSDMYNIYSSNSGVIYQEAYVDKLDSDITLVDNILLRDEILVEVRYLGRQPEYQEINGTPSWLIIILIVYFYIVDFDRRKYQEGLIFINYIYYVTSSVVGLLIGILSTGSIKYKIKLRVVSVLVLFFN